MYFHVIIELTQEASMYNFVKNRVYKYNETDLVKLSKRIIIPLTNEKNVFFHHYIFEAQQIEKVIFKASKEPVEYYVEQLKKNPKYKDVNITPKMIVEKTGLFKDITSEIYRIALGD